jgi:tRNA (guanine-N7-)-methyltransferase
LIRWLPAQSVSRIFVLFPDPWPKKRQQKRRLLNPAMFAALARLLTPGGELRIGTDIGDYARTILIAARTVPLLRWSARRSQDWRQRPSDWPGTRYEAKAIEAGRRCTYLTFTRD